MDSPAPFKHQTLYDTLAQHDATGAIRALQSWLPSARYADVVDCLNGCPPDLRVSLQSLLRDLISGYPAVRYGVPVLLRYAPVYERAGEILHAPLPLISNRKGVASCRWIESDVLDISPYILDPVSLHKVRVLPDAITVGVLMLRSTSEEVPAEPEGRWWQSLLNAPSGGEVKLFPGHVWPWIDAVEVALVMGEVAQTGELPQRSVAFLSDDLYCWAIEAGGRFGRAVA